METKKLFSGLTAIAVSTLAAGALVSSPTPAFAGDAAAHGEKSCGAKAGDKSCAKKHEDCSKLTDAKAKEECEAHAKDHHASGEKSCGAKAGEKSCGAKSH